jgi:hypothetical protein
MPISVFTAANFSASF